jgi:adenylosuccinate lyase
MVVYPENMQANLDKFGGLVHSQRVLLGLTQAGMSREDAYRKVQTHAMDAWRQGDSFLTRLQGDSEVTQHLDAKKLAALFDLGYHFKHVDTIFKRVFGA